jgi:small conductance mechanosensitive channel
VLNEILQGNSRVMQNPAPVIQMIRLGDSSVNISAKPWVPVPDFGVAASEINKSIVEAFRSRGIVIPYPQREVRLVPVSNANT